MVADCKKLTTTDKPGKSISGTGGASINVLRQGVLRNKDSSMAAVHHR